MSESSKASHELSEAEFLQLQAKLAKDGAVRAINDAKLALVGKLDPRPAARKHPILALIAAALAGFTAAAVAIPSREEQELRRVERLHRAMHPEPIPPVTNGKTENPKLAASHSIWTALLHEVIQLIKPILLAGITAGVKSATARPPGPDEQWESRPK